MDDQTKLATDRRLARVEGQVAGLRRMLAEDRYCIEILTQLAAVRSALDQVGAELVTSHVQSCVLGHSAGQGHACAQQLTEEELVDEVRTALNRLLR